jgi:hypothetical protein
LKKLFSGIHSVVITDKYITKMCSFNKEQVEIDKVELKEEVELWMQ